MKRIIYSTVIAITAVAALALAACATGSGVSDDAAGTAGGSPWLDSDIKANLAGLKRPSPREDFHLYVNYDWLKNTEIPDGRSSYSSLAQAAEEMDKKVRQLLTDTSVPGHDAAQVRALYRTILDWDARNAAGMEPVMQTVRDIQSLSTLAELSDFICDNERHRFVPVLIGVENFQGFDDRSIYVTGIVNDDFMLGDAAEYKNRTEQGERIYKARLYELKALLSRIGYTEAQAEDLFKSSLDFEAKLAEKAFTSADYMSPDYVSKINNSYEPGALNGLAASFPLVRFIKNMGYGNAERYIVLQPALIRRLDSLYTEQNLAAIKAYMLVHYVANMASVLDYDAFKVVLTVSNMVSGSTGHESDEKIAADIVRNMLPISLSRAYLTRYDLSGLKKRITELCQDIIAAYREMLAGEDWLSESTKEKIIEKLDAITIHAVYPDKWIDHSSLNLEGLSYIDCLKAIARFERDLDRSHTNGRVDRELWNVDDLLEANAYYYLQENSINIIPGILNAPVYYEDMSQEALFGSLGSIIGHEISHAFDTKGAQFDKDGNLADWWQESDYAAFKIRADKLVARYDGITIWNGLQARGANIQTEAIADIAGIKCMLMIANRIPGFDYRAFFEAYASVLRSIDTPEREYSTATQNEHPVRYLRTNVTVQQFDEFHRTFGVQKGDRMYCAPEDRILVW